MNLSVIISNKNSERLKLILCVYKNQTFKDFEVIVTGSDDEVSDYVKQHKYRFDIKLIKENNRNKGWKESKSNRVIFTNSNFVPNADCLANYSNYEDSKAAIAGYIGYIDENVHMVLDSVSKHCILFKI